LKTAFIPSKDTTNAMIKRTMFSRKGYFFRSGSRSINRLIINEKKIQKILT